MLFSIKVMRNLVWQNNFEIWADILKQPKTPTILKTQLTFPFPYYNNYKPRSKRIFESLKREITATSSPQHWNDVLHTYSRWETDAVIKHVTDIEISCEKSKLISISNPPKKGLYMVAFDYWFSYDDHDPRVWNFEVDRKVYFNNIYDCMLTKNGRDLIWKIRHGAILTGRFLYGCKY